MTANYWTSEENAKRVRARHRANARFAGLGIAAIVLSLAILSTLIVSLFLVGAPSFFQTKLTLDVTLDESYFREGDPSKGNYRLLVRSALLETFPEVIKIRDQRNLFKIWSNGAQYQLRDKVVANPDLIGQRITFTSEVSDAFDQFNKGVIRRDIPQEQRKVSDQQVVWWDKLVDMGAVSVPFNWNLFFEADSRFPELAGLAGAITGSFFALLICLLISFPAGISAAIYLEEFAPKNRLTDLIEVNINNLAAVPSIVFGLLGLAVFLNFFGLPRSSPLVGGMVLSLMTLPTVIVATRATLKSVPPSIREAALGVGASKHQVVLDHVLPLAMPGILTGTIIGLAQALGETAPLLLIGMNAFITDPPSGPLSASTALPTQILIWFDSPERGFVARTSAAILVLLLFLLMMNLIAIIARWRFERRW